jgi:hypothetical protein
MHTTARITIYIQALGGKFLGPNAYHTNDIKLTLTLDDKSVPITYKYVEGMNDGEVGSSFINENPPTIAQSSFLPILTPNTTSPSSPAVNYLTPISGTICGKIEADVSQEEMLGTLSASIPRPGGEDLVLTQSIALNQMQSDYRATLIVPGLLLEKPKSSEIPPKENSLFLLVKMMCGCPIKADITKPVWVASDFDVSAEIFLKSGERLPQNLTFFPYTTPSLFLTPVANVDNVHMANFSAKQKSTGNIGFLSVIYSLC